MDTPHTKLPLGGPAWLRAVATEKAEMNHALPSENPENKRLDDREVLGLRDAAKRIERLERFVEKVSEDTVEYGHYGAGQPTTLAAEAKKIDSKIDLSNHAKADTCFADLVLDDLYGEIEEQFGRHEDEWEHDNGRTYTKLWPFPALNDSCGSSWGKVEMLPKPDARHFRRVSHDIARARAWES